MCAFSPKTDGSRSKKATSLKSRLVLQQCIRRCHCNRGHIELEGRDPEKRCDRTATATAYSRRSCSAVCRDILSSQRVQGSSSSSAGQRRNIRVATAAHHGDIHQAASADGTATQSHAEPPDSKQNHVRRDDRADENDRRDPSPEQTFPVAAGLPGAPSHGDTSVRQPADALQLQCGATMGHLLLRCDQTLLKAGLLAMVDAASRHHRPGVPAGRVLLRPGTADLEDMVPPFVHNLRPWFLAHAICCLIGHSSLYHFGLDSRDQEMILFSSSGTGLFRRSFSAQLSGLTDVPDGASIVVMVLGLCCPSFTVAGFLEKV